MASEESTAGEADAQISFKVKTSGESNHSITMAETATVLDLKTKLAGTDYENVPADRQRLIYSGRVMKDAEPLSTYKIKAGNTIHMVKSAQSNANQKPPGASIQHTTGPAARAAAGVPTNMAAGTANNPLAGLTGARYAGHMALPGAEMFGPDSGMGAPPSEEAMASMLDDPNMQQTINEALNNPAMIDLMIQQTPHLRNNPRAREMLQSTEFRQMMTNPETLRQAARLRRMMEGGGASSAFPAPGITDTTPAGAPASTPPGGIPNNTPFNPFAFAPIGGNTSAIGPGGGAGNPFAALFGQPGTGTTPAQSPPPPSSAGQTPSQNPEDNNAPNPFASLFGNAGAGAAGGGAGQAPFQIPGLPPMTPEMMQQAMQMIQSGGMNDMFGGGNPFGAGFGAPAAPVDNRPPEERYANQLRQLNDMGFFDFDRNIAALQRTGGSVEGAIEQLLSG